MSKGQQTPYIGSRISLISKLDIRYEGVLFSVDTNESTIALAKVKSFGTEDRVPNNPIPGRDDVYEYIIFKAGDIKDLLVCENPKPVATANDGLPYDPAIVTVSTAPEPQQPAPSAAPALPTAAVVPPVTTAPVPPTSASVAPPKPKPAPVSSPTFAAVASAAAPVGSSRASPPAVIPQRGGYAPRFHRGGPGGAHRGVRNDSGGFYAPRGGYYRGAARGGGRFYPTTEKLRFDSDYDFEKANEQFQETLTHLTRDMKKTTLDDVSDDDIPDVVEGDVAKEETEEDEKTYYDKKNSFFDSISCEALEKEAGRNNRLDWRKERMTNQETFGHSAVRSLSYRRGGRGYGYRGNRGYNGGGGGGYYQNRQGHGQNLNQGGGYDGGRRRF